MKRRVQWKIKTGKTTTKKKKIWFQVKRQPEPERDSKTHKAEFPEEDMYFFHEQISFPEIFCYQNL